MTVQTPTAVETENGHQIDADAPEPTPEGNDTGEVENGSDGQKGNREARYRVERNQYREERDALAQRVEQLQTRELERIASKSLSNPADLLTLSGKSLRDFIGQDGELDAELVAAVANDLLGTRPGLRPRQPAFDLSQGQGNDRPAKAQPTFAALLKS
jgi:hypothetical protein